MSMQDRKNVYLYKLVSILVVLTPNIGITESTTTIEYPHSKKEGSKG